MLMGETAVYVEVPRYLVTVPFLGAALLLVVTQVVGRYVGGKFEAAVETPFQVGDALAGGELGAVAPALKPKELRRRFEWGADAVAAATVVVIPALGFALLPLGLEVHIGELLVGVVAVTLLLTILTLGANPGRYAAWSLFRSQRWAISPVTWIGITVNVACAAIAYYRAAPTFVQVTSAAAKAGWLNHWH